VGKKRGKIQSKRNMVVTGVKNYGGGKRGRKKNQELFQRSTAKGGGLVKS